METIETPTIKKIPLADILVGRDFPQKVVPLINEAKKSIDIIVYEWLWYPQEIGEQIQIFNHAIIRAKRRGVEVRVLVNRRLIKKILQEQGIEVKQVHSTKLLHIKLMIVDDKIAILGSHNYTKNAFNINFEMSVILRDTEAVRQTAVFFHNMYL